MEPGTDFGQVPAGGFGHCGPGMDLRADGRYPIPPPTSLREEAELTWRPTCRTQAYSRVDIANRPPVVEEKSRIGDRVLDTIIGSRYRGALVTSVDRDSKYTSRPDQREDGASGHRGA